MKVTAKATREGGWWAVEVPEVPGLFTQAKRLDQVAEMVADAAEMLGHLDVEVVVVPQLEGDDAALVESASARRAALREAEAAAAAASREAVARLRGEGLPVRDVATIMGISPQRVSVLDPTAGRRAS
ncbi:type II toxin-antitoxin system HicB family antitoxin [Cellulosimicrobium cellulans]